MYCGVMIIQCVPRAIWQTRNIYFSFLFNVLNVFLYIFLFSSSFFLRNKKVLVRVRRVNVGERDGSVTCLRYVIFFIWYLSWKNRFHKEVNANNLLYLRIFLIGKNEIKPSINIAFLWFRFWWLLTRILHCNLLLDVSKSKNINLLLNFDIVQTIRSNIFKGFSVKSSQIS